MLADTFNCKFYDKELLNLAAKESGFSEKFFEQNDEQKGFLKSLFHVHVPLMGENNFYKNNFSQDSLYQFQSDAIRKAAEEGNCVFVGRTADYVLRDFKNTISIFITANIDQRIQRVCKRYNMDRSALANISTPERKTALLTIIIIPVRHGATQRAMISVSTQVCSDWKRLNSSLLSLSENALICKSVCSTSLINRESLIYLL